MHKIDRTNNFDLIRLLAALQVLIWHGCKHFEGMFDAFYPLLVVLYVLPGVPIFFTISGFLIYHSLQNSTGNLRKYFTNRFLRIYPALWVCIIFTVLLILFSSKIPLDKFFTFPFFQWLIAQLTFFQFYTIELFRSWGVGHPNGSLWTITVEIQFYIALPVIALLFDKFASKRWQKNVLFTVLALFSLTLKIAFGENEDLDNTLTQKLFGVTVLNYFYHFCVGILIYINFDLLKKVLIGKALWWILAYAVFVLIFKEVLGWYDTVYDTDFLSLTASVLLAFLTISAAFTLPSISEKIVRGNDLSYGIYIFHMPIFNCYLALGLIINPLTFICVCLLVIIVAFLSWKFVEKPALQLKKTKTVSI